MSLELITAYVDPEPVVSWFHGSIPRSWLSHTLLWFLVQTGGGVVDAVEGVLRGRRSGSSFRLMAFSGALVYYARREILDSWRGLVHRDWVLVGDSVMDFLVPATVNVLVLVWFVRRAGREGAPQVGDAAGTEVGG